MDPVGVDIDTRPDAICLLLAVRLTGVPERQLAVDDQVCRQAGVRVRRVVVVAANAPQPCVLALPVCPWHSRRIGPGEDVVETP